MSFSSDTKEFLMSGEDGKDCCKLAELASYIYHAGALVFEGKGKFSLKISFEYMALASRVHRLIRELFDSTPSIQRVRRQQFGGKHQYHISLPSGNASPLLMALKMVDYEGKLISMQPQILFGKTCDRRAFLKAAFLHAGSLQNPEKGYHLELVTQSEQYVKILKRLAKGFNIEFKQMQRKETQVLYLKKADDISDFLALIGAVTAVMQMEDTMAKKQVFNRINRAMNCDNSNINKTISAAQKQMGDIALLQERNLLDDGLRDIARLRLENPELNLEQLGALHNPPLSKSGVNHKMRKIASLADKLRGQAE